MAEVAETPPYTSSVVSGRLVWAGMEGYPMWPAQVIAPEHCVFFSRDLTYQKLTRVLFKQKSLLRDLEENKRGKPMVVRFFGECSWQIYGTADPMIKDFTLLDFMALETRKKRVEQDYKNIDLAEYSKALNEIQYVALKRSGSLEEKDLKHMFPSEETWDIDAFDILVKAKENDYLEQELDDLECYNKLGNTKEYGDFAESLWKFWISPVGPGRNEEVTKKERTLKSGKICGKTINLHKLWLEVNRRGGSDQVSKRKWWAEVGQMFQPGMQTKVADIDKIVKTCYMEALGDLELFLRSDEEHNVEGITLPEEELVEADLKLFKKPREKIPVDVLPFDKREIGESLGELKLLAVEPRLSPCNGFDEDYLAQLGDTLRTLGEGQLWNLATSMKDRVEIMIPNPDSEDGDLRIVAEKNVDVHYVDVEKKPPGDAKRKLKEEKSNNIQKEKKKKKRLVKIRDANEAKDYLPTAEKSVEVEKKKRRTTRKKQADESAVKQGSGALANAWLMKWKKRIDETTTEQEESDSPTAEKSVAAEVEKKKRRTTRKKQADESAVKQGSGALANAWLMKWKKRIDETTTEQEESDSPTAEKSLEVAEAPRREAPESSQVVPPPSEEPETVTITADMIIVEVQGQNLPNDIVFKTFCSSRCDCELKEIRKEPEKKTLLVFDTSKIAETVMKKLGDWEFPRSKDWKIKLVKESSYEKEKENEVIKKNIITDLRKMKPPAPLLLGRSLPPPSRTVTSPAPQQQRGPPPKPKRLKNFDHSRFIRLGEDQREFHDLLCDLETALAAPAHERPAYP
ncbi:hypothetical protein HOP50_14g71530 [Chloropicon primus]|nr:hypothetical protein HOP50_14g71530 [Chloropicon primus]